MGTDGYGEAGLAEPRSTVVRCAGDADAKRRPPTEILVGGTDGYGWVRISTEKRGFGAARQR